MIFTVPGEPVGKGRPRVTRAGHAYTPEKTATYENLVKVEFERQCKGQRFGDTEQLQLTIHCFFGLAKSDSKRKREAKIRGVIRPTKKPDIIDNIVKIIADALNGVAYGDDTQIVSVWAEKQYAEIPHVDVEIEEV